MREYGYILIYIYIYITYPVKTDIAYRPNTSCETHTAVLSLLYKEMNIINHFVRQIISFLILSTWICLICYQTVVNLDE